MIKQSTSIHPNGRNVKSTCAPRNPNRKGHLAKAEAGRASRRKAYASSSSSFQAASKNPGSMKWI